MRSARAKDVWRDALKNNRGKFHVEKIILKNVRGLGDKEISFSSRFNALCGENGVGKTSLLKAIFIALAPQTARDLGVELKAQSISQEASVSATLAVSYFCESARRLISLKSEGVSVYDEVGDGGDECVVCYLDPAAIAQRLSYQIKNDADFGTALEGVAQKSDSNEMLQLRGEITGRKYSSVTTFEIEDYSEFPTFPYFRVKVGSVEYSSEDMGLGELCVNLLVWSIERLRKDSIVLLEEPESHLPPRAQERLMAYVAELVVQRNLNVIISTHSQHTLENFPTEQITFLARLVEKSVVNQNPSVNMLYDSLRITSPRLCVVAVEDHSAFAFLEALILNFDSPLLERIDFVWKNGWGAVDSLLKAAPRHQTRRVTFVGVYDGDQKYSTRPDLEWNHIYLPGDLDPAEYMVCAVRDNVEAFALKLSHNEAEVLVAVANLGTVDVKDFFTRLSLALRININSLYSAATSLWLLNSEHSQEAEKFVLQLRAFVLER